MADQTPAQSQQTRTIQWAPDASTTTSSGKIGQASIGACDACRMRKVRCLASENSMSSKCQRCTRAKRECVYTVHSKTRRRKRTDTRVKELEEKVRNLSVMLEQQSGGKQKKPSSNNKSDDKESIDHANLDDSAEDEEEYSDDDEDDNDEVDSDRRDEETAGSRAIGEGHSSLQKGLGQSAGSSRKDRIHNSASAFNKSHSQHATARRNGNSAKRNVMKYSPNDIGPDVIDRGIVSFEKATELYNRFIYELSPHYPSVAFRKGTVAADVRKSRPIVFLAMLAAASFTSEPSLCLKLNQEILQVYANKVALQGQKNIDLVQSICLQSLWYYPPERFDQLKFHQYIHMAATMALDLGLAKRPRSRKPRSAWNSPAVTVYAPNEFTEFGGNTLAQPEDPLPDSSKIESRRTLLACYLQCASVSLSLRLPNALRFTSWMADCVDALETSPDACPTDARFAAWIRLQRIAEDCVNTFSLDDPGSTVSLEDSRIQNHMMSYERQLNTWRRTLKPGVLNEFLEINFHINNLFIHEISLHPDHEPEDFRPPFYLTALKESVIPVQRIPAYASAIMEMMSSAQAIVKIYTNMPLGIVRTLPILVFVRTVYCCVVLIKLDISATASSSELAPLLNLESMDLPAMLNKVIGHTAAVAGNEGKNIGATKFLMIMKKLLLWYRRYRAFVEEGSEQQIEAFEPVRGGYNPQQRVKVDFTSRDVSKMLQGGSFAVQGQPQVQQQSSQAHNPPYTPNLASSLGDLYGVSQPYLSGGIVGPSQGIPSTFASSMNAGHGFGAGVNAFGLPSTLDMSESSFATNQASKTTSQGHGPTPQAFHMSPSPAAASGTEPPAGNAAMPDFHGKLLAFSAAMNTPPSSDSPSVDYSSPEGAMSNRHSTSSRVTPDVEFGSTSTINNSSFQTSSQGPGSHDSENLSMQTQSPGLYGSGQLMDMEIDPAVFGQLQNEQPFSYNPGANDWLFDLGLMGMGTKDDQPVQKPTATTYM